MKKQTIYAISGYIMFIVGLIKSISGNYEPSIYVGALILLAMSLAELGD